MPRKYHLKQRAARQRETRRRIVEAAIELHARVGPARTTVTAIAERAGVQRHTVYRHFPTQEELLGACTSTWDARNPFPAPEPWLRIADPEARLRAALHDVYAYYDRVGSELSGFLRDAELVPALKEALAEESAQREELVRALASGWGARGKRRRLLLAAISHALDFEAWRSLRQGRELAADEAVELMVGLVRSAAARPAIGATRGRGTAA